MSKLEYPVWSFVIVGSAILLPPGLPGVDLAVLIFRGGFAALLTLLALYRTQEASSGPAGRRLVRLGALLGFAITVLAALLLALWSEPLRSVDVSGWLSLATACLMLTFGVRLHSSDATAAWRQRVSFAAANRPSASGGQREDWPLLAALAAGIMLRDGMESVLYVPALLEYADARSLIAGGVAGGGLLALAVWGLPRLPGKRPLRRLCCLLPALTLFLGSRLVGEGVQLLQREGIMDARPAGFWIFPTTWEWLSAQTLLLAAIAAVAFRFRKRSNDFIRQINL